MSIQRKKRYMCHFCGLEIPEQLVKERSVARDTTSWLVVRGGVRRKHWNLKLGNRYAHNVCVEAAFTKGQVVGQEEMWPSV